MIERIIFFRNCFFINKHLVYPFFNINIWLQRSYSTLVFWSQWLLSDNLDVLLHSKYYFYYIYLNNELLNLFTYLYAISKVWHLWLVVKDIFHSVTSTTHDDGGVSIKWTIFSMVLILMKEIVRDNEIWQVYQRFSTFFMRALIFLSSVYLFGLSYVFIINLFTYFTDKTGEVFDW